MRIVYSPLDAVKVAQQAPAREVVFFAVGFETTEPATAMAVYQAAQNGLTNFSRLVSHVLVPPATRKRARSGREFAPPLPLTAADACRFKRRV